MFNNVVTDVRGVGIYLEDGNEYGNIIEGNVVTCQEKAVLPHEGTMQRTSQENTALKVGTDKETFYHKMCGLKNGENTPDNTDSDWDEQSGLYSIAASNDFVRNRVSNFDNAFYLNTGTQSNMGNPHGAASYRVCAGALPPGVFDGNVFHNNAGFGWYVNTRFAMKVKINGDGRVADWGTCLPYGADGTDNH